MNARSTDAVTDSPLKEQLEAFIDQHRAVVYHCLDGLTDEQARRRLVSSRTTLLGLVKHAIFVEHVWFNEAVSGRPRSETGIAETPDASFELTDADTIDSAREAYARACAESRQATAAMQLDDVLTGNRRGPLPLRWVYLHVLRELAHHCGHADILREQILQPKH